MTQTETEVKTITIANGLKELKHIDRKIIKKINEIQNLSAGQSNNVPKFGDDQTDRVSRMIQSVNDLITRKMNLKLAISRANIDTTVSFRGRDYSLQEILFMREGGQRDSIVDLKRALFSALRTDATVERTVKSLNDKLAGDKDAKKIEVVRYFDVDERDKNEEDFTLLLQELDYLIEQANFSTHIPIEPLED
jgi:hypothetical protein